MEKIIDDNELVSSEPNILYGVQGALRVCIALNMKVSIQREVDQIGIIVSDLSDTKIENKQIIPHDHLDSLAGVIRFARSKVQNERIKTWKINNDK